MKSNIQRLGILLLTLTIIFASACTAKTAIEEDASKSSKISIYTSFYTMYDFAAKIGGDKVSVTNLVPSGSEPHDWEPSPKDMANIQKADMLIYNGAGMEQWIEKVLESIDSSKLTVVEASKDIKLIEGGHNHESDHHEEHSHLKYDPHVWLSPLNAKKQMEAIKNALVKIDPENKEYYQKNYEDSSVKLDELHSQFKARLGSLPKKEFIVAHQAFGYLCDAYGLKQIAIEGLNADSEPTPARMAEIARLAKENNISVIFFEELINPKVAQALAKEVGAETEVLNPLGGLKEEDIKAGKEYFSVMMDNLKALEKALR